MFQWNDYIFIQILSNFVCRCFKWQVWNHQYSNVDMTKFWLRTRLDRVEEHIAELRGGPPCRSKAEKKWVWIRGVKSTEPSVNHFNNHQKMLIEKTIKTLWKQKTIISNHSTIRKQSSEIIVEWLVNNHQKAQSKLYLKKRALLQTLFCFHPKTLSKKTEHDSKTWY